MVPCDWIRRAPATVSQEIDGETVIIDLRSEQYFSLNPVGSRIWQLLGDGAQFDAIHSRLVSEYAVDGEQVRQDLLDLIARLQRAGLVEVESRGCTR